jgi:hypothetical protein
MGYEQILVATKKYGGRQDIAVCCLFFDQRSGRILGKSARFVAATMRASSGKRHRPLTGGNQVWRPWRFPASNEGA